MKMQSGFSSNLFGKAIKVNRQPSHLPLLDTSTRFGGSALPDRVGWVAMLRGWTVAFTVLIVLAGTVVTESASASTAISDGWTKTNTLAHPIGSAVFREKMDDAQILAVVVGLRIRNAEKLDTLIVSQQTPGDPDFGRWIDSSEVLANYAPKESDVQRVIDYLTAAGLTDIVVEDNRLLVSARASVGAIRKAFKTEMGHFTREGREAIANLTDVRVPGELSSVVAGVFGLQTLDSPHPGTTYEQPAIDFPISYAASSLPSASNTAVAIITEGNMTPVIADLHTFETMYGLPVISPTVVNVGGTSSDTSNTLEWDLDSQNIQAMAGGTVKEMLFYTATSLTNAAVTLAYNKAVSDKIAAVISISLGECESGNHNDGTMAQDDTIFKLGVAQGQTVATVTGDHGGFDCGTVGQNGTFGTQVGVSYPGSSPYVIAVGGTTLSTNGSGSYVSEAAWTYSGGGVSVYEGQPSWQSGVVSGSTRGVPDLSFDADPNSGSIIIYNGVLTDLGGTSLSAPLFAGAWARIQSTHSNALGFPAAWIYSYGSQRPASAFHDVTTGSNGVYSAGVGWDAVTGWGSFDVAEVSAAIPPGYADAETCPSSVQVFSGRLGTTTNTGCTGPVTIFNPASLPDGHALEALTDFVGPRGAKSSQLELDFPSDPGTGWLISVSANGVTKTGATASYSYGGGVASWVWVTSQFGFPTSGTIKGLIVHK